jgi:hypothetical protein
MAGDFVLAGHRVRMWPGARRKHTELFRSGTIFLEGLGRTGPYLTRKVEPAKVQVSGFAAHLPIGVFPACNTNLIFERLSRLYPAAHPVENALSVALLNVGPIIHFVLFLLNTRAIEHFPAWDIHNEGTTQSVKKLVLAHDAERIELRKALGYTSHHYPFEDHYDTAIKAGFGFRPAVMGLIEFVDLGTVQPKIQGIR